MACPRIEGPQKLQKFRNRQKMIPINLKNYARKQENEHFIPKRGLQKEQLNILEKRINNLCTKVLVRYVQNRKKAL